MVLDLHARLVDIVGIAFWSCGAGVVAGGSAADVRPVRHRTSVLGNGGGSGGDGSGERELGVLGEAGRPVRHADARPGAPSPALVTSSLCAASTRLLDEPAGSVVLARPVPRAHIQSACQHSTHCAAIDFDHLTGVVACCLRTVQDCGSTISAVPQIGDGDSRPAV